VVYEDFGLRPVLRVARRSVGSTRRDVDEAHCRSIERFSRDGEGLGYALLAPLTSFGARDHGSQRMRCEPWRGQAVPGHGTRLDAKLGARLDAN